jgi:hypothetical protein
LIRFFPLIWLLLTYSPLLFMPDVLPERLISFLRRLPVDEPFSLRYFYESCTSYLVVPYIGLPKSVVLCFVNSALPRSVSNRSCNDLLLRSICFLYEPIGLLSSDCTEVFGGLSPSGIPCPEVGSLPLDESKFCEEIIRTQLSMQFLMYSSCLGWIGSSASPSTY